MLCRASLTGLFFLSIGCVQSNNSGDSIQLIQRSGFSVEIPSDWKEGKGFKKDAAGIESPSYALAANNNKKVIVVLTMHPVNPYAKPTEQLDSFVKTWGAKDLESEADVTISGRQSKKRVTKAAPVVDAYGKNFVCEQQRFFVPLDASVFNVNVVGDSVAVEHFTKEIEKIISSIKFQ